LGITLARTFVSLYIGHEPKARVVTLKLLNYKHLLIERKTLIFKKNQINFVKNQKKIYVSYFLSHLSKLIFSILFEENIK